MPAAITDIKRFRDDRNYYAEDIKDLLGISENHAYKLIRELNAELEKQGFLTIKGRVPKEYFHKRWYGSPENEKNRRRDARAPQRA